MGKGGDEQVMWSTKDEEELARKVFKEHLQKGYLAIRRNNDGQTELIQTFDQNAEEIILTPPITGG